MAFAEYDDYDGLGLEVCGNGGSTVQGLISNRFYWQQFSDRFALA